MLDKQAFSKGIEMLTVEFKDKGFVMTKERAAQWFEFMQRFSEEQFLTRIKHCLRTCRSAPTMADIINPTMEMGGYHGKQFSRGNDNA